MRLRHVVLPVAALVLIPSLLILSLAGCGGQSAVPMDSVVPTAALTPVPGSADVRADGVIYLGGLELHVAADAAADAAIDERSAAAVVMEGLAAGEGSVLGAHEDAPPLHLVAAGFVPGLEAIIGPAGGTDFAADAVIDAWVIVLEGQGGDGRYTGVGVVDQHGDLLTLYVISPGVG